MGALREDWPSFELVIAVSKKDKFAYVAGTMFHCTSMTYEWHLADIL